MRLYWKLSPLAGLCAMALAACSGLPAEAEATLPAVPVEVEVTVAAPEAIPAEAGATVAAPSEAAEPPPDDPAAPLKAAIEAKDYATLQTLLTPQFGFGVIASEGVAYSSEEFLDLLQTTYLGPGNVTVDLNRDVRAEAHPDYHPLLDNYARTLYSSGWGDSQNDTALLFLDEGGQWEGMLYMFEGLEDLLFASGGGVQQPPANALPPGVDNTNLGSFQTALLDAITTNRDYALLAALMGDPFSIGYWQSEGVQMTPAEAAELLRTDMLPPDAFIDYRLGADLSPMLGGQDPLTMFGPGVDAVTAIFSDGWGDGSAETVLIIARRPDGTYYWHALLYAPFGF